MQLRALNLWLAVQASSWLPAVALLAWAVATSRFEPWMLWVGQAGLVLSFATLWRTLAPRTGRRPLADFATLARFLGLIGVGAAASTTGTISFGLWAAMIVVALGDLVDGWCARRFGGSDEGAVLDMETDQLTTLSYAAIGTALAGAGLWTLLLPSFRYAFVLAMRALGLPAHDPKPCDGNNTRGRTIAALVMTLLIAVAMPGVPQLGRWVGTAIATLALAFSYQSDVAFLLSRRREARGGEAA